MNDKLVENIVREVLLEYNKGFGNVAKMSKEIFKLISQQQEEYPWKNDKLDKYGNRKIFNLYLDETNIRTVLTDVCVTLYAYDPDKMTFFEKYNELDRIGYVKIKYSSYYDSISLNIPWPINNEFSLIEKRRLILAIDHEVKKALRNN